MVKRTGLALEDERFGALVAVHGVFCDYIHDYGNDSVRLASVEVDRSVTWAPDYRPSA